MSTVHSEPAPADTALAEWGIRRTTRLTAGSISSSCSPATQTPPPPSARPSRPSRPVSGPAGVVATTAVGSPHAVQTAPADTATAVGRAQLRRRKSPWGVWWLLCDSQPVSAVGSPTGTLATCRLLLSSILDTVPSPELATQAAPPPT